MNGGEVVICDDEEGCGEPFEILYENYFDGLTCPYCGEPCGPTIEEVTD